MEESVGVDWDASLCPQLGIILTNQLAATMKDGSLQVVDSRCDAKIYTPGSERLFSAIPSAEDNQNNRPICSSSQVVSDGTDVKVFPELPSFRQTFLKNSQYPEVLRRDSVGVDWDASLGPQLGIIPTNQVAPTMKDGSLQVEVYSRCDAKIYPTGCERLFSEVPSVLDNQNNRPICSSSQDVPDSTDVKVYPELPAFRQTFVSEGQSPEVLKTGTVQNAHGIFPPYPSRENRSLVRENSLSAHNNIRHTPAIVLLPEVSLLYEAADSDAVRAVLRSAPWLVHGEYARHALYVATQRNKTDVVGAMLVAGVDPNGTLGITHASGTKPLHMAVKRGSTECLQLLLAAGADVNARHTRGWGALHLAAFNNHPDCIRTLVKSGALVNAASNRGYTPLHTAVQNRRVTCVTVLLQAGADSKLRNRHGHEPICYAWTNKAFKTVREILWYQKNVPSSSIGCDFPKCNHDMERITSLCSR